MPMEATVTPMLKQYREIKARHQDCILFFRLGDFYEMFFEDATTASSILDLVLTSRGSDAAGKIPMCGIPYHSSENYIAKLVKAGRKVAICEQIEDVAVAKGIVKRDVIRVISAGTYLDDATDSRYLLCLSPIGKMDSRLHGNDNGIGFAFCDTTGGAIYANTFKTTHQAIELIAKLPIFECLCPASSENVIKELLAHPLLRPKNILLSPFEDWCFNAEMARKNLCSHFGVLNLNGFGLEENLGAQSACGAMLEYLRAMNKTDIKHIDRLKLYADDEYVFISPAAHYGLELESVLKTLDLTQTPMGRRKFRFWLYHPLKNIEAIKQRQEAIHLLYNNTAIQTKIGELLRFLPDLEKALSRIACGCGSVKDLLALRQGFLRAPLIAECTNALNNPLLKIDDIAPLRELLTKTINPDVPLAKPEGKIVQTGIDKELDELRNIQDNGRQWLANFQADEIKRTGINSLKVGFNNVFGYYIEITKANQKAAPAHYIRKQTLVNGERYITPELKEYEEKFLTAQEKILKIERRILDGIQKEILNNAAAIHRYSESLAALDCLWSMSSLFSWGAYILPEITTEMVIDIKEGRHPVVEKSVSENFVANDSLLDTTSNHLIILTGPNMAGKSTYIRQTAILVIMAQMGSPIPALSAKIGVADKIFTRIGAHDEIAKGQSTFMVEMTETADILNNLTPRSLVILDEIGRGTSTSDGLSLAWGLAEYLQKQQVRVLFATHFHELVALADKFSGVKNYNVAVKEWKDKIIFMHKIVPGGSDDSYGIYVAKLAGIPEAVIKRSKEILSEIEIGTPTPHHAQDKQLNLFAPSIDPVMDEIKDELGRLDINSLTPMDALKKLDELKRKIQ